MKRISIIPRPDFASKLESIGLSFHSWDNYWKEDACYQFTLAQIEEIEKATEELHFMCVNAVKSIIINDRFDEMGIPKAFHRHIKDSFAKNELTVYGRFDFAYDGVNPPKMLEYNADTPTSLLESAVAQWYWMEECFPGRDQFNSLHEKLIEQWKNLPGNDPVYLASVSENEEDWVCAMYMLDVVRQSGREVHHIFMDAIGWDSVQKSFVDGDNKPIKNLFKLYPWEWMMREAFAPNILESSTRFVEPVWKSLLSNKALLPILWEMYPDHPNILPAFFTPDGMDSYAKKPFLSREGSNIQLFSEGKLIAEDDGPYSEGGFIYQKLVEMPCFDGKYPVIGSWVVGNESAGMCIREDSSRITTNMSNFVPHYFTEN